MSDREELFQIIWDGAVDDRVKDGKSPEKVPVVRPKVWALVHEILAAGYVKSETVTHIHWHDMESHARSFNEGYETAMSQELADDPTRADDWFNKKLREAKIEALRHLADDFSVNLTVMSGPKIRAWITAQAEAIESGQA